MYKVVLTKTALKQLKKMDKNTASLIVGWIEKNLNGCQNPRVHGKALVGDKSGKWRYRVGNYRIITQIEDDVLIVQVVTIGHRRDIYN